MSYSFQRESILNILQNTEDHQSVDELHKKLSVKIPKVSLMTVYRNLNKLVKEGIVFPFHIDNALHYCGNNETHFHLHCVTCNKVVDVYNTQLYNFIQNDVELEEFLPLLNGIMIKGFCNNCKGNK